MKLQKDDGITLITLVITIIILLILASVTIVALSGDNGILNNASLAKVSTEFANYKEETELYKVNKLLENNDFDENTLTAGPTTLEYENKPDDEDGNIKTIITDLDDQYLNKFIIIKGKLFLMATGKTSEIEIRAAQNTGIEIMPYEITEDGELVSSNVNLALQGGSGTIVIPEIVTSIGSGAFSGVEGLKTLTIPGTVKRIGSDAFSYNKTLENVIIEDGVEEIGNSAFYGCSSLKSVMMADSVKLLGTEAFRQCTSLEDIDLSKNITKIGGYTFSGCRKLYTLDLPEKLSIIGDNAFGECYLLNDLKIPKDVVEINLSAFFKCENLFNLTIDKSNNSFVVINNILYTADKKQIITLLASNNETKDLAGEEGVEKIGSGLFSVCKKIETINFPSTLKNLVGESFSGIETLKNITIPSTNEKYKVVDNMILSKNGTDFIYASPNREEIIVPEGVKNIGSACIHGSNIKSVKFENDVEKLEKGIVFRGCTNLQNISFGKNVSYINPCFKTWGGLSNNITITIDLENINYEIKDNYIVTKDGKKIITYINHIKDANIPEGIEQIGDSAFQNSNMETIKLPTTLKEIGKDVFAYCVKITEINIPSNVEKIGNNAFSNCSSLIAINIDKAENTIGGQPWDAPKGLKVVNWNS